MEPAMFFVESGDHRKFTDPFPTIQQLLTLAAIHFMRLLGTFSSAPLYNPCSHQENIFQVLKSFFMIRV
jgi:hypothetical protein